MPGCGENPKSKLAIEKFATKGSPIRSLCSSSMSGESILAGCENGQVFLVGANIPGRAIELFELDGPASALRVIGQNLHIQQGWERKIVDWKGKKFGIKILNLILFKQLH